MQITARGGACLGLPPRPVLPGNAWPFKADQARLPVVDARGRGCRHVGRGRQDSRLRAPVAVGSRSRRPCPSPAPLPGALRSGTPSPGALPVPPAPPVPGTNGPLAHSIGARGGFAGARRRDHRPCRASDPGQFVPSALPARLPPAAPSPVRLRGAEAGVCWRSLGETHASPLSQVALDAPGWGRR